MVRCMLVLLNSHCHRCHRQHQHRMLSSLLHQFVRCSCHQCHCRFPLHSDALQHSHHCSRCCWSRSRRAHYMLMWLNSHCHTCHRQHQHRMLFSLLHQLVRCSCHQCHCRFPLHSDERQHLHHYNRCC